MSSPRFVFITLQKVIFLMQTEFLNSHFGTAISVCFAPTTKRLAVLCLAPWSRRGTFVSWTGLQCHSHARCTPHYSFDRRLDVDIKRRNSVTSGNRTRSLEYRASRLQSSSCWVWVSVQSVVCYYHLHSNMFSKINYFLHLWRNISTLMWHLRAVHALLN
jgi:hypothetical protein